MQLVEKSVFRKILSMFLAALFVLSSGAFAEWGPTMEFPGKIRSNPVNGGYASVSAVWNSGSGAYDLQVEFKDVHGVKQTKSITSIGTNEIFDHKPTCAVDPTSGDVAVAWTAADEFKYLVFDADGTSVSTASTLAFDGQGTNASDWDFVNFVDELPTMERWGDGLEGSSKFEGWLDIVHSGVAGDGWHIVVSYMYAADSMWDDFYATFGETQAYSQSILFRFATVVFQNVGTVDEVGIEIFSSNDLRPDRQYFDHPQVRLNKEWVRVPAKVTPITSVTSSGRAVSGVLYVPTLGAIYNDYLKWAEDGVTTGSLDLDREINEVSVASSSDSTGERIHIAYGNTIRYKTPGSGTWAASIMSDPNVSDIREIIAIPQSLDSLYAVSFEFRDQHDLPGGLDGYPGDYYYDLYLMNILKISDIDNSPAISLCPVGCPLECPVVPPVVPPAGCPVVVPPIACPVGCYDGRSPAYFAFTPYVTYPVSGTLAINESTPGTPSEIHLVFHQAHWDSKTRYDEDWQAIEGESVLTSKLISTLTVTAPNGGEEYEQGDTLPITWSSFGTPGSDVKILAHGAGQTFVVTASTGNDGEHDWVIPTSQDPGVDYIIEVRSISAPSINDTSNAPFSITETPASITVLSPNGGEVVSRGTYVDITWVSAGNVGADVKIVTRRGNSTGTVITSTPNDGHYEWFVPGNQAIASNYLIQVSSVADPLLFDTSNATFEVDAGPTVSGTLTVLSPNGGESVQRGGQYTITWSHTGYIGQAVKIILRRGTSVFTVTQNTPNDGTFEWSVPTYGVASNYRIEINSVVEPTILDQSDGDFSFVN